MKYLFVLFFLMQFFVVSCTPKSVDTKPAEKEVLVKTSPYNTAGTNRFESTYEFTEGKCRIAWQTISTNKDKEIEVQLINRSDCNKAFGEITSLHDLVIDRLLKDYPAAAIKNIATGGLKSLQPDGSWNTIISNAARASKDYLDFRKNYPNHRSNQSVNTIFMNLVRQNQPHAPFKQMLASHGLNFELISVEKVFNSKMNNGETVIDDAGMFWWKPNAK